MKFPCACIKHISGERPCVATWLHLTNFRAPFFKEIPSFFCGVTPSKTLAEPQPLNIAFPLGNGGVLRSEEGGGIQERRGRWGGGKKKEKRTRKKCSDINYPLRRNDYQNYSVKIILCNCPGAITGFLCRAPENNSPNIFSCKSPCPVRAPPGLCPGTTEITEKRGSYRMRQIISQKFYCIIAPGALTGFSCRAPRK